MTEGIKKSEFTGVTTVSDAATFDFVTPNGENFKIPMSVLGPILGLTGSITSIGDAAAVPVLQKAGSVNQIRAILSGAGVRASVDGADGIILDNRFVQDIIGLPLVDDLTIDEPVLPSFVPGVGIGITKVDDVFTISFTGAVLPATKVVTVNLEADFPAAVAGVITLEASTIYIMSNDVSTASRFVMAEGTIVMGYASGGPQLEYTGTGTMFTGVDVGCSLFNLNVKCALGKVFDFSDTVGGVKTASLRSVFIAACDTIGTFNDLRTGFMASITALSVTTQGVNFIGSSYVLMAVDLFSFQSPNAGFIGIDLGTAVGETIRLREGIFNGVAGAVAISGAASNANLTATGKGSIKECTFTSPVDPTSGIDPLHDVQWLSESNQGLADTRPDTLSYNTAGDTVVITVINTPVEIGGTWVDDNSAHFEVNLDGTTTYVGIEDLHVPLDAIVVADPVSGTNKDLTICFAIDGVAIAESSTPFRASSGDLIAVPIIWQRIFQTGEVLSLMAQNDTDTVNINITKALLRVN